MMDTILMFKQAALNMQQDARYLALDHARREVDDDSEIQGLIGEFNIARMDLNTEMLKDERDEDEISRLNDLVNTLYGKVVNHPKMLAFNEAKTEAEKLTNHIDAIINTAMNGGDPMTVEEPAGGCGGNCSSCGGCH